MLYERAADFKRLSEITQYDRSIPLLHAGKPSADGIECEDNGDPDQINDREVITVVGRESLCGASEGRRNVQEEVDAAITEPAEQNRQTMNQGQVEQVIEHRHAAKRDQRIGVAQLDALQQTEGQHGWSQSYHQVQ